jgi:hypothetical protein
VLVDFVVRNLDVVDGLVVSLTATLAVLPSCSEMALISDNGQRTTSFEVVQAAAATEGEIKSDFLLSGDEFSSQFVASAAAAAATLIESTIVSRSN